MKEYVKAYEKMTIVNAFIMLIVGIIMTLFPLKMMSLLITIISSRWCLPPYSLCFPRCPFKTIF